MIFLSLRSPFFMILKQESDPLRPRSFKSPFGTFGGFSWQKLFLGVLGHVLSLSKGVLAV